MCIGYLLSWNSSGSGVLLCQCGFIQERNHWIVATHLKLWECTCWWCQRNLGFVLPGQTLLHWAVLTWAVPAAQAHPLCSCASPLTCVWCLLLTVTAGPWGLGIWVLTSLKSHREARSPHLSQDCWTGHLFLDEKFEYDGWVYTCLICEGEPPSYSGPPALPSIIGV